ncbi:hypothetical protein FRC03_011596 [Tulasnella sp. 419]|nr:hypothetical protein FRC02_004149 [Tulasnella sp. 418]KAG8954084.1 hypothetical protein FRC03_011596 [Tulasnella sp. 419]
MLSLGTAADVADILLLGWAMYKIYGGNIPAKPKISTPEDLKYAEETIARIAACFPGQPWVTEVSKQNFKILKKTVKQFRRAHEANGKDVPVVLDHSLLPNGLDYAWLRNLVNKTDLTLNIQRDEFERTSRLIAQAERFGKELITQSPNQSNVVLVNLVLVDGKSAWFEKKRDCARGSWCVVWEGELWMDSRGIRRINVAFKELKAAALVNMDDLQQAERVKIRMERELQSWLAINAQHPNIVPLLGYVLEPRPGFITKRYAYGTLQQYFHSMRQKGINPDRIQLALGCAEGIAFLHSKGIIHGDIRACNVLVSDWHVPRIIDFGGAIEHRALSEDPTAANQSRVPNEVRYLAPERTVGPNIASFESDVYSFGCLLLFIMTGLHPFTYAEDDNEIVRARYISPQSAPLPGIPAHYPQLPPDHPMWELLDRCWNIEVKQRPKMPQIESELRAMCPDRTESELQDI